VFDAGRHHLIILLGLPVLAFLLGSIPWGVVFTRIFTPIDIRSQGSGNIGATNVSRVAGSTLGILTFIGDVLKGAVPVYVAMIFLQEDRWTNDFFLSAVALSAFLGHIYPLFLKFKSGGKGVATAAGCFVVLDPPACLSALLAFMLFLFLSRRVSVGSLSAAAVLPIGVWFSTHSVEIIAGAGIMSVLIFIRHADNIQRLISGIEPQFSQKKDPP